MNKKVLATLMVIALLLIPQIPVSAESVPVKLWDVSYNTYTAQFIGDEKVVIYTMHGDMDLGYRYISTYQTAYIYDIKTGEPFQTFTPDSDGDTFNISTGAKIWDKSGFFSGNGRFLLEDPWAYGTGAKVVDLETKTTYTINWTDTEGIYYGTQMDYYGNYFVVGEKTTDGRAVVFKRVEDTYEKIWNSTPIGEVRRVFFTLDAKYVVYGALAHNYLYIAEKTNDTYQVIAQIPLEGGVGALGCTDPYNIGYILVGTDNGHIYIFNTHGGTRITDPELVVHLTPSETGTTERFYNPFYNRWSPIHFTAVAFSTTTDPYVSVIVDITTGKYYTYSGSGAGRATAVSLQGNYIFAGRSLYMLIQPDVQEKEPRVRFHGTAIFNYGEKPVDLSKPVILESPENREYHTYFESGSIKITSLSSEERPVSLITDTDITFGYLGRMLDKGYIAYDVIYQDGAEVGNHNLVKIDDRTVAYFRTHTLKNIIYSKLFGVQESMADSGIVIRVPLQGTVSSYTELIMNQSIAITTLAPVFDWKGELLGAFGLEILSGATAEAISKKLMVDSAQDLSQKLGVEGAKMVEVAEDLHPRAVTAGRTLGKAIGVVGIGLLVDSAVTAYTHYIDYSNIKTAMFVVPVVEDTSTRDRYAVVAFILPESEIAERASEYSNYVKTYLKDELGVKDVGVTFIAWGSNWDEYNERLKEGRLPQIDLDELVRTQVASAYGISESRLAYKEVAIVIDTFTRGYASLWDFLTGGLEIPIETRTMGYGIDVKGVIPAFTTTDPDEIVALLPKVLVNGEEYDLSPSSEGAIAQFSLPTGTTKLVITFEDSPYLATMRVDAKTLVKSPFVEEEPGVLKAQFHYDWENTLILVDKIEFVDMPYEMKYCERTFIYRYGEFTHDITDAFELSQVIDDETSPSGKRYFYVTEDNTKFIDPANGGMMQPCKTYVFRYYYIDKSQLGNAWVEAYFNGTNVASTIPRHASIYVGSNNTEQTISGTVTIATKYKDDLNQIVTDMEETHSWSKTVPANESILIEYDIEKYVARAQELLSEGKVGFVEVHAKITSAEVNEITTDDESRIVYYPPPTLPETGSPVALNIRVLDYINQTPVSNATVTIDDIDVLTTNAEGWANTSTTTGLHTIEVTATGYQDYIRDVNVYDNMTHIVYLIPKNATTLPSDGNETIMPPIEFNETVYYPLEVLVQYQDGHPYEGALITVNDSVNATTIFTGVTDGSGYAYFPIEANKTVDVSVVAGNFTDEKTGIFMNTSKLVVFVVNQSSGFFTPEVAVTNVSIHIHRGQGWFYGDVSHLVLTTIWTNKPQTVDLYLRLFDAQNNTVSEKTISGISLSEGANVIMEWLDVNVSTEFKDVTIYAEITSYQYDTDLENNRLTGNTVTLKPFLDMYATVIWKPVKQKLSYAILPEDVIEVDIGYVIPAKITGVDIRASVSQFDLSAKQEKSIIGKVEKVATLEPTVIWRNFTITVPFTNEIIVEANISRIHYER